MTDDDVDLADPAIAGRHLDSLRLDRRRLAALAGADLDAPVPPCPGWALRDLIDHTGRVHRWAAAHLAVGPDEPRPPFGPGPGDREPVAWLLEGLDALIDAFATTDLRAGCPTFAGPASRAWWLRRQAMETAVHRWDAQVATGAVPDPIDADVAERGVDEWCDLERRRWFTARPDLALSVHLHATDDLPGGTPAGDGEWFLEVTPDGLAWDHGHRKGDVAVRASRSDLFLLVWRRVDPATLDVFGEVERLEAFLAATAVD